MIPVRVQRLAASQCEKCRFSPRSLDMALEAQFSGHSCHFIIYNADDDEFTAGSASAPSAAGQTVDMRVNASKVPLSPEWRTEVDRWRRCGAQQSVCGPSQAWSGSVPGGGEYCSCAIRHKQRYSREVHISRGLRKRLHLQYKVHHDDDDDRTQRQLHARHTSCPIDLCQGNPLNASFPGLS